MRASLLVAVGLLSWALPAAGQTGSLEGAVLDSATRAPLSGVRVTALDQSDAVAAIIVTDGRGRFRLTGVAPAPYTLLFTRLGYATRRIEAVAPAAAGSAASSSRDCRYAFAESATA